MNTQAPRSFRDPGGFVLRTKGRIFRVVKEAGLAGHQAFNTSPTVERFRRSGRIISTLSIDAVSIDGIGLPVRGIYEEHGGKVLLEHEPVPFPNFPYEWAPEMLHQAASLTLELAIDLAGEGLSLKDATPYNVMFRGAEPVLLDVLSVERRDPGDPIWLPEAQLIRSFLLPLAVWNSLSTPPGETLLTHRDGLEPEVVYRRLSAWQKVCSPWLTLASIPTWFGRLRRSSEATLYERRLIAHDQAQYIFTSRLKALRRRLTALTPSPTPSVWSGYMEGSHSYTPTQLAAKEEFVAAVLREFSPLRVLDVGCNNGHFSFLAARNGAETVSIDSDPVVIGQVWRRATAEGLNVLPLVVNLASPTPAMGWNTQEYSSFLDRASGHFDLVLMLAVIHHLAVTERIPLQEILDTVARITTDLVLIEYVGPNDSMFRKLTRGRDDLHRDFTTEVFESECQRRFDIVRSAALDGSARRLYLLRVRRH